MIIPHPSNISYVINPTLSVYNEIQLGFNIIKNTMVSIRTLTLEDSNNKIITTDSIYTNYDESDYDRIFSGYKKYILQKWNLFLIFVFLNKINRVFMLNNDIHFSYSKLKQDSNGEYKTISFDFYIDKTSDIETFAEELKNKLIEEFGDE